MAVKSKAVYVCKLCGFENARWLGQCPDCKEWNTLEETEKLTVGKTSSKISYSAKASTVLSEVKIDDEIRFDTKIEEFNRVLGGGLVKGSIVLLGGDPGIGKSTILLQLCGLTDSILKILYVSGEESLRQIKLRAERLLVENDNLHMLSSTNLEEIVATIETERPDIVIIDSIQTMQLEALSSSAGSVTQVRECTTLLQKTAKQNDISIFIVGHVNKDGAIAGPKVLEHIVDTVLYFEGDRNLAYRILRAVKNRYGNTNEIGVFEMEDRGLVEVSNPSAALLEGRPENAPGSAITCITEGSRPLLLEVQALLSKTSYPTPRRTASGFDYSRFLLLMAVIEKRGGLAMGTLDSFINTVGGFKVDETAADLAACIAIISSILDKPVPPDLVAFGEIGLSGEVRSVASIEKRISEASRLGFSKCAIPAGQKKKLTRQFDCEIIGISNISDIFKILK